ncbi:nitrous oxide reductase family maturation protein NosD [Flavobacterium sp. H122]|uniref:nitrous oxide reductase family maturation protein NosD n=1 Tax=Flavobacterium sp. H122 TaxID=2529860 RepID=UPI0010AACBCB|nr:nitrous oxide reductase family maturation protein NosD [Flavobacterium sp. H122]
MRLFLILFFSFCFQTVFCRIIHVGKKYEVKSVKKAIALAKTNDTVYVHQGIYKEGNITIDKPIVFLGIGYPVLDGQKKFEVLSVKAGNVIVKGFKLINSGHAALEDPCAVKVYNQSNVQIINNKVLDNFFGIYIQNGNDCIVKGNLIVSNGKEEQLIGNGIHCWKSTNLKIIGNRIKGHRDGIYFEFVTNSVIWRNSSTFNVRYGLHFMFSNDDSYITNIFAHNGAGVAVMFTKNVKMFNNYFQENWGDSAYGLLLKEISDSYIFNNKFSKNTSGIYMEGTTRVKVEKNVFEANGWGMKIQASCMDNEVTANNFVKNTFDISTNGSLVLNTFNSNYWDKYEGYDLNKDGIGDVPYHPLSLFAVLTENTPSAMLLYRSFMITLLDKSEKVLPSITPDNFEDKTPRMKIMPL